MARCWGHLDAHSPGDDPSQDSNCLYMLFPSHFATLLIEHVESCYCLSL